MTAPWDYPTLLCTPGRTGGTAFPRETVLPLEPQAYAMAQDGKAWRVTVRHTGEVIYAGPGPVQLVASPAPF
ncbi:hypothetical protein B2J86_08905 [Acidovorax sp. SRB_14]|uniref:hypothetical protein n=1 Tax=Acidovorax sp. SRB_14 TaxID=1962699 RepID=UPI0015667ED6|nr:hypothetical protein [Acidovorax sp. SRB_14]NMM81037.1 hypothetical protein [Acidovorax sp. SRB_14]